ncbi:hypothetical protein NRIC_30320 [Enterococcus florum]|uniref:Uncharacterized protein n=1 Tax=Enterococcus florum TaxID=2480627 RepID=A0A4P5PFH1_9ENTE|nr:hypothetical protein NRIC_30320 [Enterococcus florum]
MDRIRSLNQPFFISILYLTIIISNSMLKEVFFISMKKDKTLNSEIF